MEIIIGYNDEIWYCTGISTEPKGNLRFVTDQSRVHWLKSWVQFLYTAKILCLSIFIHFDTIFLGWRKVYSTLQTINSGLTSNLNFPNWNIHFISIGGEVIKEHISSAIYRKLLAQTKQKYFWNRDLWFKWIYLFT